jgi:hypothetical protein
MAQAMDMRTIMEVSLAVFGQGAPSWMNPS